MEASEELQKVWDDTGMNAEEFGTTDDEIMRTAEGSRWTHFSGSKFLIKNSDHSFNLQTND